jgi:hypothetical protein
MISVTGNISHLESLNSYNMYILGCAPSVLQVDNACLNLLDNMP